MCVTARRRTVQVNVNHSPFGVRYSSANQEDGAIWLTLVDIESHIETVFNRIQIVQEYAVELEVIGFKQLALGLHEFPIFLIVGFHIVLCECGVLIQQNVCHNSKYTHVVIVSVPIITTEKRFDMFVPCQVGWDFHVRATNHSVRQFDYPEVYIEDVGDTPFCVWA